MNREYLIGVDFNGTKISAGLVDLSGKLVKKFELPTDVKKGKKAIVDNLIAVIEKVNKEGVMGVGIACPGPVNKKKGILLDPMGLPGFKELNLKKILEEKLRVNVFLENDANCIALAESKTGDGKKSKNLVILIVDDVVCAGIIIENRLYSGFNGYAGEFGHTTVEPEGLKCTCGNLGCLSMYITKTGIMNRYNLLTGKKIEEFGDFLKEAKKETDAKEIIQEAGAYLGIGIANAINTFDPEIVILAGAVSNVKDIVSSAMKEMKRRVFTDEGKNVQIVVSKLEDAGIIGAASIIKG